MSQDKLSDFGRYLQACRTASGRSLDEIAKQTKITRTCLQHIENEDLKNLPHPAFVKGFLRAYAEAVGADADDVLQRYQNRCGVQNTIEFIQQRESRGDKFWLRFLATLAVLVALIGATLYGAQRFVL